MDRNAKKWIWECVGGAFVVLLVIWIFENGYLFGKWLQSVFG